MTVLYEVFILPIILKNRIPSAIMIFLKHIDIVICLLLAHLVTHDLKDALDHRMGHNVDEILCDKLARLILNLDSLHVFIGIFHLDTHQFVNKIVEPCAVRRI